MEFDFHGVKIRLHGAQQPNFSRLTMAALKKHLRAQHTSQSFYLSIVMAPLGNEMNLKMASTLSTSAPPPFLHSLQDMLTHFYDIFSFPESLPPACDFDHQIPLLPNTTPANIQSYQYPHFLEDGDQMAYW